MQQDVEPIRFEWADSLEHGVPETVIASAQTGCLSPEFTSLDVRMSVRRLPDGEASHFHARLGDTLLRVYEEAAKALREPLLPPPPGLPLDVLLFRARDGEWRPPVTNLDVPLWEALAEGMTRHLGIDYKLIVRINVKWGVAPRERMTPRELLVKFGFDPTQFTLYKRDSKDPLPPDTPISLHRGEHFEAQKNGHYGDATCSATLVRGLQRIEDDVEMLRSSGEPVQLVSEGAQRYVEATIAVPSPPWSGASARILIAIPANYPAGGLDAFYVDPAVTMRGAIHRAQAVGPLLGRRWNLISWHYANGKQWNPRVDDLQSHLAHCRGFFLERGVVAQ
jgi:hypothetical protein